MEHEDENKIIVQDDSGITYTILKNHVVNKIEIPIPAVPMGSSALVEVEQVSGTHSAPINSKQDENADQDLFYASEE